MNSTSTDPAAAAAAAAAQAAAVKEVLRILTISQIYEVAVYAVAVWEYIVTFKDEYKYIWPSPWSIVKVAFLLNRYGLLLLMGLVTWQFTTEIPTCAMWFRDQPYSVVVIVFLCAIIMSTRVYAIYGKPRWMIPFFGTLIVGEVISMSIAASKGTPAPYPPGTSACLWSNIGGYDFMWLFFAYPLVFDTIIATFTTYRCLKVYRQSGGTSLLSLVLRDGLLFFFVVVTVNLINTVSFIINVPAENPALHSPLSEIVTSIMCSRIVLNLRMRDSSEHGISVALPLGGRRGGDNNPNGGSSSAKHLWSSNSRASAQALSHQGGEDTLVGNAGVNMARLLNASSSDSGLDEKMATGFDEKATSGNGNGATDQTISSTRRVPTSIISLPSILRGNSQTSDKRTSGSNPTPTQESGSVSRHSLETVRSSRAGAPGAAFEDIHEVPVLFGGQDGIGAAAALPKRNDLEMGLTGVMVHQEQVTRIE